MTHNDSGGLEAVEEGPLPSDPAEEGTAAPPNAPPEHPTVTALRGRFGDTVRKHRVHAGSQHVVWIDPSQSYEVLEWLRDAPDQAYDMMSDVTGVDYGQGRPINVVYQLFSTKHKRALRVRCELPLDDLRIDSVVPLWQGVNWLEREVYDLFGVTFEGHPDLRRILMPYDYAEGHPLRKDFPLRGRFTRAEQTRRALDQDVDRFYTHEALLQGGEPQQVVTVAPAPGGPPAPRPDQGSTDAGAGNERDTGEPADKAEGS